MTRISIVLLNFLVVFHASADGIRWIKPEQLDIYQETPCASVQRVISDFVSDVRLDIQKGLTTVEPEVYQWTFDVLDKKYILVSLSSSITCGSRGCSTELYEITNTDCKALTSPNTHVTDIGLKDNRLYFQGERCGVWSLTNKLVHIENMTNCEQ